MSKLGSRSVIIIAAFAFSVALVIGFLVFAEGSQAAFPGANGKIVYDSSHNLYIMDSDGGNLSLLADGARPAWSPDGARIVFLRRGDVWVMDADGDRQMKLTDSVVAAEDPTWSPDGQNILFVRAGATQAGLFLISPDGGDERGLASTRDLGAIPHGGISWSPDGDQITFGGTEVIVFDVDSGNTLELTADGGLTDLSPIWSPDGSQIAWNNYDGKAHDIWVMDANGDNRVNLTDNAAQESGHDWSPDGTKIVFASDRSGDPPGGPFQIYVMNSDGTCPTLISTVSGFTPAWQPVPDSLEVSPPLTCESPSPSAAPLSTAFPETPGVLPPMGGPLSGRDSVSGVAVGVSMLVLGIAAMRFVGGRTRAR